MKPPGQILLVGPSVRAAAESARAAGFEVIGLDLFGDVDTVAACDRYISLDDLHMKSAQKCLTSLSPNTPLMRVGGIDSSVLQAVRKIHPSRVAIHCQPDPNVQQLRRYCHNTAAAFPQSTFIDKADCNDRVWSDGSCKDKSYNNEVDNREDRWLVKDPSSSGGLGVRWNDAPQATGRQATGRQATGWRGTGRPGLYRQRYIPGTSVGVSAFCDGVSVSLLGICRSLHQPMGRRPFVYAGSVGPLVTVGSHNRLAIWNGGIESLTTTLLSVARNFASDYQWRGCFNLDGILSSGRFYLLEINARYSASMELIERASQKSLIHATIAAESDPIHQNNSSKPKAEDSSAWVYKKEILYADNPLRIDESTIQQLVVDSGSLHDLPQEGTTIGAGEPICTRITGEARLAGPPPIAQARLRPPR